MRKLLGVATLVFLCVGIGASARGSSGVCYSVQLGTFNCEKKAGSFLNSLPESLKKEAFIYKTDRGFYTVRVWPSCNRGKLKGKMRLLKRFHISGIIVKTDMKKVLKFKRGSISRKRKKTRYLFSSRILYSIQLGTFNNYKAAKRFLSSLNENIRSEAFIYKTDSGFFTVRIWPSKSASGLKRRLKELYKYSLKGIVVKTSAEKVPKKFLPIESVVREEPEPIKIKREDLEPVVIKAPTFTLDTVYYFSTSGKGETEPAVPNRTDLPPGTWENRRAEVEVVSLSSKRSRKKISLGEVIDSGFYRVRLKFSYVYPEKLYGAKLFVKVPDGVTLVIGSSTLNGKPVKGKVDRGFLVFDLGDIEGNEPVQIAFKLFVRKELELNELPYILVGRLRTGKKVFISKGGGVLREFASVKDEGRLNVKASKGQKVNLGILFPDRDVVVPTKSIDVEVAVPIKSKFSFTVNGTPIPKDRLAEKSVDRAKGVIRLKYLGIPLEKGENTLALEFNGKKFVRKVVVSGELADLSFKLYPEEPVADGKSSAYVIVEAHDKDGRPARVSTYIEVYVDKGDIYDYKAGTYKKFVNDGFKVRLVDGKAVIRLSPAKHPEERTLRVVYGDIEREVKVQFYPEKRPWLVVGELEGAIGFSGTHNSPSKFTEMPYDHSGGDTDFKGRGALFAKGALRDYTVTIRYDTKKPDDVLLKQNIPSTEEGQFYPVYGDDSEQYFEAKSKRHLYLRIDKGLSFFLFGDYNTEFGSEFDFNKYSRTFNGILVNLEEKENFRIKSFITENSQGIVKEEFKGRGTSGPFFLKGEPVEFSEKVWIEVRDRYNPNIIIEKRQLNRFTDYEINYESGFIILHQPLPEFDQDLNPQFLIVTYETEKLKEDKYMYGLRGEKWIRGVRLGAFGIKEEHPQRDKKLYGFDVYYYKGGLKLLGEVAHSEGFEGENFSTTNGGAYRLELSYSQKQLQGKLFYKKVEDGFQNPSSTTAEEGYTTYGVKLLRDVGSLRVSANALVDDRENTERKEADVLLTKRLSEKFSIDLGARYNEEDKDSYVQAIGGIQFMPTKKLTLKLRREQSIGGDRESSYYPTRTIVKVNYKWSNKTNTYLQTEIRELPDETNSLTTFGVNSQIDENTTAYSKYTLDDGSSGWRTQSHIGLNRVFKLKDDLAFDFGIENVHTFSGNSDKKDYTAFRLRGLYTQNDRYKLSGEYQIRFGRVDTEHLLRVGGVIKPSEDYTLLLRDRFFLSDYRENEILLGLAKRPVKDDKLNYLLKLRWKVSSRDETTNRYILSYHVNWQPKERLTLMGEYAAKYVDVKDVGTSFTDLIRGRVLYDVTDRLDFGFHAGLMRQTSTDTYTLSWGPEVGYVLFENFWISLGYNFNGFKDDDFDDAKYWAKGFYVKFRLKFDESYLSKLKLLKKFKGGS